MHEDRIQGYYPFVVGIVEVHRRIGTIAWLVDSPKASGSHNSGIDKALKVAAIFY